MTLLGLACTTLNCLCPLPAVHCAPCQVLAEAGPEGMHVEEIAREIQKRGFRDLRSSKTPEASGGLLCPCLVPAWLAGWLVCV